MTFEYTDRDGDSLRVMSHTTGGPGPIVSLIVARADGRSNGMFVPVDRVEEVVAGVRDAARQAAGRAVCRHPEGYEGECPCRPGCACCRVTAAVGQQPTQQPATDLPERLAAILTERLTALGNPFSGMRINFQGPDEWPASREVSPNDVAEVLRDLLADGPAS